MLYISYKLKFIICWLLSQLLLIYLAKCSMWNTYYQVTLIISTQVWLITRLLSHKVLRRLLSYSHKQNHNYQILEVLKLFLHKRWFLIYRTMITNLKTISCKNSKRLTKTEEENTLEITNQRKVLLKTSLVFKAKV